MVENEVLAYSIRDACRVGGIGRTTLYGLINAGKIEARALGGRTIIPARSLRGFLESLPAAPIRCRAPAMTSDNTQGAK